MNGINTCQPLTCPFTNLIDGVSERSFSSRLMIVAGDIIHTVHLQEYFHVSKVKQSSFPLLNVDTTLLTQCIISFANSWIFAFAFDMAYKYT